MKLTRFERYLLKMHHFLDEIGLHHFLIGSTLLASVREKRAIKGDKEVNFGVFIEDLIPQMPLLRELFSVYPRSHDAGQGITFLMNKNWNEGRSFWRQPIGLTALQPMYIKGNKFFYALEGGHTIAWDRKFSENMRKVKYLGKWFYSPSPREEFIENYFGKNWRTPDPSWNWQKSELYCDYKDLLKKD